MRFLSQCYPTLFLSMTCQTWDYLFLSRPVPARLQNKRTLKSTYFHLWQFLVVHLSSIDILSTSFTSFWVLTIRLSVMPVPDGSGRLGNTITVCSGNDSGRATLGSHTEGNPTPPPTPNEKKGASFCVFFYYFLSIYMNHISHFTPHHFIYSIIYTLHFTSLSSQQSMDQQTLRHLDVTDGGWLSSSYIRKMKCY